MIWLLIMTGKKNTTLLNTSYLHWFLVSSLYGWSESLSASIHPSIQRASFLLLSGCKHSWSGSARTHDSSAGPRHSLGALPKTVWRLRCYGPVWGGWEQIGGEGSFKKKRLQILFSVRRRNVRGRGSLSFSSSLSSRHGDFLWLLIIFTPTKATNI